MDSNSKFAYFLLFVVRFNLLGLQYGGPTDFSVEEKERELFVHQRRRQQNKSWKKD